MTNYSFGVEIEMVAKPHKTRNPLISHHALYYEKVAAALRKRGLNAEADNLRSAYSKRPEHYDKWWITKDGSLGQHEDKVPIEAVSPILLSQENWAEDIDTFWTALRAVFHTPERSMLCGAHVHVSRGPNQHFSPNELKKIAFGIVLYEPLILKLLLQDRANNQYCKPNTRNSAVLRNCRSLCDVSQMITHAANPRELINIMQDDRYVLWNFSNTLPNKSGTIEFRGGRCLRGENRTKRWIAFTIATVHFLLYMNNVTDPGQQVLQTPKDLYEVIRQEATRMSMGSFLPEDYRVLNESS